MVNCRICNSNQVERIFSLPSYPVFIGCTDEKRENDVLFNFEIWHCTDCDVGQQIVIPPFEELYKEQRCFGYGKVWKDHYEQYFEFIKKNSKPNDEGLEVGVGNAVLYKKMLQYAKKLQGIDAISNPEYENYKIKVGIFSEKEFEQNSFDLIFSSHFIEHLPDPVGYLKSCHRLLKDGGKCFLACPNISESFQNLHFNAFTSDHLNYFTKESLSNLASILGFELVDFYQYLDHGMYLALKKVSQVKQKQLFPKQFKKLFDEYVIKVNNFINKVKMKTTETDFIYLFGAHGLTVTFLKMVNSVEFENKIKFVLDNEQTKQNRRLSGTNLICKPPTVIQNEENPIVILYMGAYENEISQQLKTINQNCQIILSRNND